jgi:hypothetical protein
MVDTAREELIPELELLIPRNHRETGKNMPNFKQK